jgi:hypothetical protein
LISSGLLALIIATAFAVLLSSVSDLRASERRARQSEEVLVEANRLERLVIDLETGQRGFIITGEQRFLEPWRDARTALPSEASTLERLVADSPQQEARAQALTQATDSYLRDYSIPLVDGARRDLTSARSDLSLIDSSDPSASSPLPGSRRQMQRRNGRLPPRWRVLPDLSC